MTRGRKPTPTHLKLVRGNPGKRAVNDAEPKPQVVLPVTSCRTERGCAGRVGPRGGRASSHRHPVRHRPGGAGRLCQAYGRWILAERAIAKMAEKDQLTEGLMIRTTNGNAVQNPLIGIANKAMADMVRYAAEFGMTPSAAAGFRAANREARTAGQGFAEFG